MNSDDNYKPLMQNMYEVYSLTDAAIITNDYYPMQCWTVNLLSRINAK